MKKPLRVACSPLTKEIYVGHLIEKDPCLGANITDVTVDILCAVVEYCEMGKKAAELTDKNGNVVFRITVEDLRDKKDK